jgi:chromosome segregation ATPase
MRGLNKTSAQPSPTHSRRTPARDTTSSALFYSKRSAERRARDIAELEVQFQDEREQVQKSWREKVERITELTKKSNEIDALQLRYTAAGQDIDVANGTLEKTIAAIHGFEKEREAVYSTCKALSESMESATKGENLDLRSATLDNEEKALERRKFKIAEFAKNLARLQLRANALAAANEVTDTRIKKVNDQSERVMADIEQEMSDFDLFNMPSKSQD